MEIKKTIKLNITKKGKQIICRDLRTLGLIMGTTAVSGNYHFYKVKKEGKKFIVSVERIKERIQELEDRKDKIEESLEIMKQVV